MFTWKYIHIILFADGATKLHREVHSWQRTDTCLDNPLVESGSTSEPGSMVEPGTLYYGWTCYYGCTYYYGWTIGFFCHTQQGWNKLHPRAET